MAASRHNRLTLEVAGWFTQWKSARQQLVRGHAGRSAVHQWRICSRRLFALEALLAPAATQRDTNGLHALLDAAFHAAGKLRDAQLAAARLRELSRRFPAAERLHRHLQHAIPRQRDHVARHVRDIKPRAVRQLLHSWANPHDPDMESLASRAGLRLRREHLRLQRAQGRCRTARSLHRYRVQLKSLLYMQEFARAAGLCLPSSPAGHRHGGRLQRQLGEISDLRALIRLLDRFAARHPAWRRESSALRRHLQRQQLQRLEQVVTTATH